jgi:O-acetyl-ADP-ribose deacetylase (regulator of RNase III)
MRPVERIRAVHGDITKIRVDVIVNAANEALIGAGGVDRAIHRAAGPALLEECQKLKWCDIGDAKVTEAYLLPARHIIHTVGPVWEEGLYGESEVLAQCYRRSLQLAKELGARTISFPAISCGAYGFPPKLATTVAVTEVRSFTDNEPSLKEVLFVCFDKAMLAVYEEALRIAKTS